MGERDLGGDRRDLSAVLTRHRECVQYILTATT